MLEVGRTEHARWGAQGDVARGGKGGKRGRGKQEMGRIGRRLGRRSQVLPCNQFAPSSTSYVPCCFCAKKPFLHCPAPLCPLQALSHPSPVPPPAFFFALTLPSCLPVPFLLLVAPSLVQSAPWTNLRLLLKRLAYPSQACIPSACSCSSGLRCCLHFLCKQVAP